MVLIVLLEMKKGISSNVSVNTVLLTMSFKATAWIHLTGVI